MRNLTILFLLSLTLFVVNCGKEPEYVRDYYLIFGYYSASDGCPKLFKLNERNIQKSTTTFIPKKNVFFNGEVEKTSSSDFYLAQNLNYTFITPAEFSTDSIPLYPGSGACDSLMAYHQTDFEIGAPKAHGYYIEFKDKDWHYSWIINSNFDSIPTYLHTFLDSLEVKLNLLH